MNALRGMQQMQAGGMQRMMMFHHMKVMQQMQAMAAMHQRQQAHALYVAYQAQVLALRGRQRSDLSAHRGEHARATVRQQMAQLRAARQHQESQAQALVWQQMQQEMQQMYEQQEGDWTQVGSGMCGGDEWGAQWEGLGRTDRAEWRTVLGAIAWGTSMLQLEKQVRHVFTRAYLSRRLITPFKAYWAQRPPIGTRIFSVAMGDAPGPNTYRLRTVDPAWLNLRGRPPGNEDTTQDKAENRKAGREQFPDPGNDVGISTDSAGAE
ncbi:unnamed protein product [Prorocentrum cordatum]|uniref:Uncharacterized protein n=1 Tax=Prorocentrum cordatum TaxID=2364126 RepID=A0ABN9Y0V7_9DINO|nr:unnamed protein product [Polarella glacialis]